MDLDKGASLQLADELIPDHLKSIKPIAEKWGFFRQADRDLFAAQMMRKRPEEVQEFNRVMDEYAEAIRQWNLTLPELDIAFDQLSKQLQSHPFWAYLHAKKCRELTGARTIRKSADLREERSPTMVTGAEADKLMLEANDLFRRKEYTQFVQLIENTKVNWPDSLLAKLRYAKSKVAEVRYGI